MAPHEFLLPINLKKSKKLWKFGFFDLWPLFGLQKFFWPFFQFSWPSDVLNIPNHSNLNYFEAILPSNNFCWKICKPDQCMLRGPWSKFFIVSTEFDKNISDWRYDCTDLKNGFDFFMRLVKWPKITVKKCQNLISVSRTNNLNLSDFWPQNVLFYFVLFTHFAVYLILDFFHYFCTQFQIGKIFLLIEFWFIFSNEAQFSWCWKVFYQDLLTWYNIISLGLQSWLLTTLAIACLPIGKLQLSQHSGAIYQFLVR
mgnify:CR=1 FL=1